MCCWPCWSDWPIVWWACGSSGPMDLVGRGSGCWPAGLVGPEAPMRAEFLQKRLISAFFGFQWLNLAEILPLFKKYNNVGKVAVKRVSLTDYAL